MNEYHFEELNIGKQEINVISIDECDIDHFATFSGDHSAIHVDDEYAMSRDFDARLAHGLLVASHISGLIGMKLPGKHGLLQSINCNFIAPCYVPNILTITVTVKRRSEAIKVVGIGITVVDQVGSVIVNANANSVLKF